MTPHELTTKELESILNTPVLYKYLDLDGALQMIKNHNLKFAGLATLNDPYDCYPGLIDFKTSIPDEIKEGLKDKSIESVIEQIHKDTLYQIGLASFSDSYKNLFLWGYYNYHQGVCLGLDTAKLLDYLTDKQISLVKVNYVEQFEKLNFWQAQKEGRNIFTDHLIRIKSTVWEKEKEIRLVYDTFSNHTYEIQFPYFLEIPPDCFVSLHLGAKIQDSNLYTAQERIAILLKTAWNINPAIKIYNIRLETNRFDLKRHEITKEIFIEKSIKELTQL